MQNNYENKGSKMDCCNQNKKKILRLAFFSMLSLILLITSGCSSGDDDAFVLTHQGQFLDAPVRGLDYICGGQSGVTDKDGMFTFERGKDITFKLGNIQIGETVPVVSGLSKGEFLPDVWVFTPRMLVPVNKNGDVIVQYAKNRDTVVANILRFLQTLDEDYNFSDGIDNAANGIYISDTVRKNASTLNLTLDFKQEDEASFKTAAESVISKLTGEYRPLIPKLAAQHHFMVQLINNEIDDTLNHYDSPGVTMSVETPCPSCDPNDPNYDPNVDPQDGVIDGIVRYDEKSYSYIWDFAGGYADVENKRPMTIDTRFRICSLTKSFVAMTVLKLVEQEKIKSYNDSIFNYLKDPRLTAALPAGYDKQEVTIARVMNHTAGIPNFYRIPSPGSFEPGDGEWVIDFLLHPEKQWDREERIELVQKELEKGLSFPPTKGWEYSNTGYMLLGILIEDVIKNVTGTEKTWEQVMREEIIQRYELIDTIIPEIGKASISESISDINYYSPYDPNPTDKYAYGYMSFDSFTGGLFKDTEEDGNIDGLTKRDIQDPSFLDSAGSMISTAPDLRKWIKLIATNGMFNSNWLSETSAQYEELFFTLVREPKDDPDGKPILKVGANLYHNTANKRYIISGNSTGYDVNTTYDYSDPNYKVAVGACANRTFDPPESSDAVPDIWKFEGAHTIQIKDALVFDTLDILIN